MISPEFKPNSCPDQKLFPKHLMMMLRKRRAGLADRSAPDFAVHVAEIRVIDQPIVTLALALAARMIVADAMPQRTAPAEAVVQNQERMVLVWFEARIVASNANCMTHAHSRVPRLLLSSLT